LAAVPKQVLSSTGQCRSGLVDLVVCVRRTTAQDWITYGQIQQSLTNDPDYAGLLIDAGHIATWENYVSQTIPDM
jgi:hypothetical protein